MSARPRSDEKARLILAAAQKVLAEQGFAATTVAQVAAEAGVSRGLLHYHFQSKEDLLARVVEASFEPSLRMLGPMLAGSASGGQMAATLAHAVRTIFNSNPEAFTLTFEGWSVSRQSPAVALEMRRMFQRFRAAMETGLLQARDRGAIDPPLAVDRLSMLITALMDGLALQLVLEPELALGDGVWDALEAAIRRLLGA